MINLTGTWTVPFLVSIAPLLLGAAVAFYLRPGEPGLAQANYGFATFAKCWRMRSESAVTPLKRRKASTA